ncbi:unnamed protein product [Cyprideis torosa]|uniref:Uncharacterized protein n=1 Tax=Cyprideis torosa TaxID=163714 RepID=A0A7R8WP41_9CRUS|nr:unnamed protein product [Cyprideis torosa]CAG0905310.1 unnamed protein product [Cyprideis torosa]
MEWTRRLREVGMESGALNIVERGKVSKATDAPAVSPLPPEAQQERPPPPPSPQAQGARKADPSPPQPPKAGLRKGPPGSDSPRKEAF